MKEFRGDIEGLRGVAILLVVLFHANFAQVSGGFIGVDIFFVISGFLISGQLYDQVATTGSVRLGAFWAARMRRLVPLLVATVAATLLVGFVVYSPLSWSALTQDAAAALTYISNLVYIHQGQQYFQSEANPFLHTWSLAAEEQFYLVWPLLFGGLGVVARKLRRSATATISAVVSALGVCSFAALNLLGDDHPVAAFYGTPFRAWEFVLGFLAFRWRHVLSRYIGVAGVGATAGWIALASIVVTSVTFDAFTNLTTWPALLPTVATAVLLVNTSTTTASVGRLLSVAPLRHIGRVSYAWYLLHWPAIVIAAKITGRNGRVTGVAAALASLAAAFAFTHFLERPIREAASWKPTGATVIRALAITATGLLLAGGLRLYTHSRLSDPYLSSLVRARAERSTDGSGNCQQTDLAPKISACVYGAPDANITVVLVGDSHAAQWAPAVEAATGGLDARLIIRTKGLCPAIDIDVATLGSSKVDQSCRSFREQTAELIATAHPDVIVMAHADYTERILDGTNESWQRELGHYVTALNVAGTAVVFIDDNPYQLHDPVECLVKHPRSPECSVHATDVLPALDRRLAADHAAMAVAPRLTTVSTAALICDEQRCWSERNGIVVYSDTNHLTKSFVLASQRTIRDAISAAVVR